MIDCKRWHDINFWSPHTHAQWSSTSYICIDLYNIHKSAWVVCERVCVHTHTQRFIYFVSVEANIIRSTALARVPLAITTGQVALQWYELKSEGGSDEAAEPRGETSLWTAQKILLS